jgi:5-methylcytosine-specific restriction endonuclease McrA
MFETEIHHIKTRASGGSNHDSNLLGLCAGCHTQEPYAWHRNRDLLLKKFPRLWEILEEKGWTRNKDKLVPPPKAERWMLIVPRNEPVEIKK